MAARAKKRTAAKTKKLVAKRTKSAALPEPVPGLARPAQRALLAAGITKIRHFAAIAESELAALHGMGPNALDKIKQFLKERGVEFSTAPAKTAKRAKKGSKKKRR